MGLHPDNHPSVILNSGDDTSDDSVVLINPQGQGQMVIVCEHATNWIPPEFNNLGLDEAARGSHITWDPGAMPVAEILSAEFDAPLITPGVSRLVFDCNRHIQATGAIVENSDSYHIPGNIGLSEAHRQSRAQRYHTPFHGALDRIIDRAAPSNGWPVFVTIHSFTPVHSGVLRQVEIGMLHDEDRRLALEMLRVAEIEAEFVVRLNEPYSSRDGATYTLAKHAVPRGLLNVMVEVRSDLIENAQAQKIMAERLAGYLKAAIRALDGPPE
jgi:predicted N-formylglutamate amidohydrolase